MMMTKIVVVEILESMILTTKRNNNKRKIKMFKVKSEIGENK